MSRPLLLKIPKIDYDSDCILIKDNNIKIDWDTNKENIFDCFSSFRNSRNIRNKTNIFIIIDELLKENYNDILPNLSQNKFRLVKYLYFLKKEFDDKINNNEIPKFSTPTYLYKMKNIRYIVIFDDNQHPLYIYDLDLNKIIDAQKCKILY
jgi:hypothetical protein